MHSIRQMASKRWIIWAAPLTLTAALAIASVRLPAARIARPVCAAMVLSCLMFVADRVKADEGWPFLAGLGARLAIGSLLSGAFLLLLILAFYPYPIALSTGPVGVPMLVALGQRRSNLALLTPYVVFGWSAFVAVALGLRGPID